MADDTIPAAGASEIIPAPAPAPATEYKDRKVYNIVDMDQAEKALVYAKWAVKNYLAPKNITGEQYYMLLLAGNDLGMTLMEINNSLCIINGRVTIWGPEVITRVNRAGYRIIWSEKTREKAEATITDGTHSHKETFTLQQAKDAGIYKDVWLKYPADMLWWKVVARLVKFFCPQVIGGYYIKEDYEADVTVAPKLPKKPDLSKMQSAAQEHKINIEPGEAIEVQIPPMETDGADVNDDIMQEEPAAE